MYKKFGFTLIEIIIVISIIAIIIPVIFSIIYSIMRQQVKLYVISKVKREGDNALNIMSTLIRNRALSVHGVLPPSDANKICVHRDEEVTSNIYFLDKNKNWFYFDITPINDNYQISSNSSQMGNTINLTSYLNTNISNFNISCKGISVESAPVISVSFTISQPLRSDREEETASFNYQTKIKLRSH